MDPNQAPGVAGRVVNPNQAQINAGRPQVVVNAGGPQAAPN